MSCIFTGAVVKFVEYGVVHVCDVFRVGDCDIIKGTWKAFHDHDKVMSRDVTHEVRIENGILDEKRQFAAVEMGNIYRV